jgi:hypothetical protein
MARNVGEQVLDERPADSFDREVVERREVPEAVFGDADRLRAWPHPAGRPDDEALEPRLRDIPEPLGGGLVEDASLAFSLDVELEGLRVLVNRERA